MRVFRLTSKFRCFSQVLYRGMRTRLCKSRTLNIAVRYSTFGNVDNLRVFKLNPSMKYLLEIRFEDKNFNAIFFLVSVYELNSDEEADNLLREIKFSIERNGAIILSSHYNRIESDSQRASLYKYYNFRLNKANASIKVEEYYLHNPNQKKRLYENLREKLFNSENSIAKIGEKYKIPVKVFEKDKFKPFNGEYFYYSIELLKPDNQKG